jgi:hypothetical protein
LKWPSLKAKIGKTKKGRNQSLVGLTLGLKKLAAHLLGQKLQFVALYLIKYQ